MSFAWRCPSLRDPEQHPWGISWVSKSCFSYFISYFISCFIPLLSFFVWFAGFISERFLFFYICTSVYNYFHLLWIYFEYFLHFTIIFWRFSYQILLFKPELSDQYIYSSVKAAWNVTFALLFEIIYLQIDCFYFIETPAFVQS